MGRSRRSAAQRRTSWAVATRTPFSSGCRSGLLRPSRPAFGRHAVHGSSAGSNIAGPDILTTNDWNVVALDRFEALGLVPFNINPHYRETDPVMASSSETRDDRIRDTTS